MLQSRVRQPSHSRDRGSAPQTHLRELVAQSSHGRPARSPTEREWRQLPQDAIVRMRQWRLKLLVSQTSQILLII